MGSAKFKKTGAALVSALALALALMLVACGGNAGNAASSSASGENASVSSAVQSTELVGKPWVTSVLAGNLPAERPEAKDDLYTHYAYDYLAANQAAGGWAMKDYATDLQDSLTALIKDGSKTSHDMEQLRILYNQAADVESLKKTGLSEVQPYLDKIDAVKSIDELNALIVSEDFPFNPFTTAVVKTNDTRATNIVGVMPNFLFCNPYLEGGAYYQETDDPQVQQAAETMLMSDAMYTIVDFMAMGMDQESATNRVSELLKFEQRHGKFLDATSEYLKKDYGAVAQFVSESVFSLDELCALCPNYPLKEVLSKLKKGGSEKYNVTRRWAEAFNDLWTADNLDMLKLIATANVLEETRPYRDQSVLNEVLVKGGQQAPDADASAYAACNSLDTFAQVLAKTYVEECLGAGAKERLSTLSQQLVDEYKGLIANTAWMSEESRQRIVEKLDHITLNILEPTGGYFDYSGVELVPTDKGGTLLSNYLKLKQYRYDCEAKMIGQPAVAVAPWFGIEPTVMNAFYDAEGNSINVMPGYMTRRVYTEGMTDEELLACLGFTIGHEISHGFDYLGSQLDAYGQPNPVFVDGDVDKFVTKTSALALLYNGIELMPDLMVNGQNVVGEAGADLSGMQVSLELAGKTDGFDYTKFFDSLSNVWACVIPGNLFLANAEDTHPLSNLRVNVNSQMFDAFYGAMGVVEGDGMYLAPEQRIVMWGPNA